MKWHDLARPTAGSEGDAAREEIVYT